MTIPIDAAKIGDRLQILALAAPLGRLRRLSHLAMYGQRGDDLSRVQGVLGEPGQHFLGFTAVAMVSSSAQSPVDALSQ